MCGIFGWAGKTPTKFNKAKFDVLGIFNESRGTDSCGVTSDGEIYIGIDKKKVYKNFLHLGDYLRPKVMPVVIGHTRNSSKGSINEHNAHPFGFGPKDDNTFEFIGVHNGTIHNAEALGKEFGVEEKIYTTEKSFRYKIDSEMLLEILYTSKSFKVLNKYNGGAAVVFTNTQQPNVVYCFHGASKKREYGKDDVEEERPLFYWRENKHSLYISSMEDSLYAIGGTEKTVKDFKLNAVYKITDGDIDNAEIVQVKRSDAVQEKVYTYGKNNVHPKPIVTPINSIAGTEDITSQYMINLPHNRNTKKVVTGVSNIYNDAPLVANGKIHVSKLRYVRNGHPIKGIYCYIPKFGFYPLGMTLKQAESQLHYLGGKEFFGDDFVRSDQRINNAFVPFTLTALQETIDIRSYFYYFFDGVRLKTSIDYSICVTRAENNKAFDYAQLSNCSWHPVVDISFVTRPDDKQGILLEGELFTGNYAMMGSDKIYHIVNGNCKDIEIIKNTTRKMGSKIIKLVTPAAVDVKPANLVHINQLQEVTKLLEDNEITLSKNENNDLLEKSINEMFLGPYKDFPLYIKRLQKYGNEKDAEKAIQILERFVSDTNSLIAIEYND